MRGCEVSSAISSTSFRQLKQLAGLRSTLRTPSRTERKGVKVRWLPYATALLSGLNLSILNDWSDDVPRRIYGCWLAQCSWSPYFYSVMWAVFGSMLTWTAAISYFRGEAVSP